MNHSEKERIEEVRITEALRRLSAASPLLAPVQLEHNLRHAFRRHHARRRMVRLASAGLVAAVLVIIIAFALLRTQEKSVQHPDLDGQVVRTTPSKQPDVSGPAIASHSPVKTHTPRAHRKASPVLAAQNNDFLALPSYHPSMGTSDLQIVRLELPASDLGLVGAPVIEGLANHRVQADFLIGRDGTPYAVRLVRATD